MVILSSYLFNVILHVWPQYTCRKLGLILFDEFYRPSLVYRLPSVPSTHTFSYRAMLLRSYITIALRKKNVCQWNTN